MEIGGVNFSIMTKHQLVQSIMTHDTRSYATLMRLNKDALKELFIHYRVPVPKQVKRLKRGTRELRERREHKERIMDLIDQFQNEQITEIHDVPVDLFGSLEDTLFQLAQRLGRQNLIIEYGDHFFTLTINNIGRLVRLIDSNMTDTEDTLVSDQEFLVYLSYVSHFNIVDIYIPRRNQDGAFFKYTTKFNNRGLKRYGIYHEFKAKNYNNNCFFHTMKTLELPRSKLDELKTLIRGESIPLSSMENICDQLQIKITVKTLAIIKEKYVCRNNVYGRQHTESYVICLVGNHFFPYDERTKFTSFSIKNYDIVKDFKEWNRIVMMKNGRPMKSNTKFIDSFNLVRLLLENKESVLDLIECNIEVLNSTITSVDMNFSDLDYSDKNTREYLTPRSHDYEELFTEDYYHTKDHKYRKIFFDFETHEFGIEKEHRMYLCSYYDTVTKQPYSFTGSDCAYKMLNSLPENCLLFAHNAGYDITFILKYLYLTNYLDKGVRSLFTASGLFTRSDGVTIRLIVKDTYKHISAPLSKFGEMFKLDVQKEVMPYDLVNYESSRSYISFDLVKEHYKNDKKSIKTMKKNIIDWKIGKKYVKNKLWFSLMEYSKKYCELDTEVLALGYSKFRKDMHKVTKIDIDDYVSIAAVGDAYFKLQGVYDGVLALSGVPRAYIQKCIVGGRTMSARNEKFQLRNYGGADFDATGLYISGMYRLGGLLIGKPLVLTKNLLTYDFLKNQSGYFVQILVKSVGIVRDFPLMSYYTKKGVRHFTNDMIGKKIFIDKTGLEDLIVFHNITFDIIDGYYFNQGRNYKLGEVANYLFQQRKIAKAEGNPIEQIYKLLMNSCYGKSLLKPINEKVKIFNTRSSMLRFVSRNFNRIKECVRIAKNPNNEYDKFYVKVSKSIGSHFNSAHVGCEILSMSKRIMNEVMCTAEDNGIQIFYQDTDSMHMTCSDVELLREHYNKKYNKELIGKNMGQFHIDFELDGAVSSTLIATDTIILGKKCYIDKLRGLSKDGEVVEGYHVRMKGVTYKSISHAANGDFMNLYERLFNGETITFDLCCGGTVKLFKFNKNRTVSFIDGITDKGFTRTLSF